MSDYRLRISEIKGDAVLTIYTRWLESVQARGTVNQEVYVSFSPQFERIWLESKKHLPEYVAEEPANIGLRSQYSLRLYSWAKKYVSVGTKCISLEQLRKSARFGVGKGRGRKRHSRGSATALGQFSPEGFGYCGLGDHQEDGSEDLD